MNKKLYLKAQKNELFKDCVLFADQKIMKMLEFNITFLKKIILEEGLNFLDEDEDINVENNDSCYDKNLSESNHCNLEQNQCCNNTHCKEFNNIDNDNDLENNNESIDLDNNLLRQYSIMLTLTRIIRLFEHIIAVSIINKFPEYEYDGDFAKSINFLEEKNYLSKEDNMMIGTIAVFADEATSFFIFESMIDQDEEISLLTNDNARISNIPITLWHESLERIETIAKKLYE